jgi:hypothetical protein
MPLGETVEEPEGTEGAEGVEGAEDTEVNKGEEGFVALYASKKFFGFGYRSRNSLILSNLFWKSLLSRLGIILSHAVLDDVLSSKLGYSFFFILQPLVVDLR